MSDMLEMEVWQSNRLVEAAQTLTLNEKRLVLAAAALHDPRRPLPAKGTVTFHVDDFASVFGITSNTRYEALADATRRLYNRTIRTIADSPRGKGKRKITDVRWVWMAEYNEGAATVTLGFSPAVAPYLTMLQAEFTRFKLKQIGNIGSFYGLRLYELFCQYRRAGERTESLERMREMLDVTDKYPRLDSLRARVLDPAIKEINRFTDLQVTMTAMKRGRSVTHLRFKITENDQLSLDLQENGVVPIEHETPTDSGSRSTAKRGSRRRVAATAH